MHKAAAEIVVSTPWHGMAAACFSRFRALTRVIVYLAVLGQVELESEEVKPARAEDAWSGPGCPKVHGAQRERDRWHSDQIWWPRRLARGGWRVWQVCGVLTVLRVSC